MTSSDHNHQAAQRAFQFHRLHVSSDLRLALLFILPTVVLVAVLMYYPMARVVKRAVQDAQDAWLDRTPTDLCRPGTLRKAGR